LTSTRRGRKDPHASAPQGKRSGRKSARPMAVDMALAEACGWERVDEAAASTRPTSRTALANRGGPAQVGPIDIGAQVLARDDASRLAIDPDAQPLAKLTHRSRLPEVANRCSTARGEVLSLFEIQSVQVGQKCPHARTLPNSNLHVNTFW
jgi:hypothetical protein